MVSNTKFCFSCAATLIGAVIIGFGTLAPPSPGGAGLPLNDKQLHFLAFCMLVLPLLWYRPGYAFWLVPAAIGYGALIELVQPVVGRSGDWADLLADMGGVLTGILVAKGGRHIQRARQKAP